MALFGSKTKKSVEKKDAAPKAKKAAAMAATKTAASSAETKAIALVSNDSPVSASAASVILRPRVTEKSGILSQGGVYTFEVMKGANKPIIAQAIKALYKVVPIKVAVSNLPARKVFIRGKRGVQSGMRKAVVTLKKGDKIDFI
jgi:large subunit ribosomal protein L23